MMLCWRVYAGGAVFDTLIESGRRGGRKGPIEAGIVSFVGHGAIVAAAVFATMQVGQAATGVRVDTALVFVTQPQSQPKPPEAPPPGMPTFKGFQTVVAPVDIPTNIPAVDLQEIQAIVDTTGHVEPNSVRIVRSPNPEFNKSAHDWILKVVFRPARVRGQAVRVLVEVPIDYRISSV
jgi:TonB-like protein